MKWLLGTYTARYNRRHQLFGHLFSGRYKALFVEGSGSGYLKTDCDYVHLGWKESDLSKRPKGDQDKLELAIRLRSETTATTKWIAARLRMGTWPYLNHLLYWRRRRKQR
jgi:hypothetical protein